MRRQQQSPSSEASSRRRRSTVASMATAAVVVYGAYRVADWWFQNTNDNNNNTEEQEEGDEQLEPASWWSSLWMDDWGTATQIRRRRKTNANPQSPTRQQAPSPIIVLDARTLFRLRKQRLLKCRQEALKAFQACWIPSLVELIEKETCTTQVTQELKALRKSKLPNQKQQQQEYLWIQLQTLTLTRLITMTYASTLLFCSMTIQWHRVGGQLFHHSHDATPGTLSSPSSFSPERVMATVAQRILVATHDYVEQQGIPLLLDAVRRAVQSLDWKPTTMVTETQVQKAMETIHHVLEYGTDSTTTGNNNNNNNTSHHTKRPFRRNWIRIVLPDDLEEDDNIAGGDKSNNNNENNNTDDACSMALDELWDLASSPAWQDAQAQILQSLQRHLQQDVWSKPFHHLSKEQDDDNDDDDSNGNNNNDNTPHALPVAKLVPHFKSACGSAIWTNDRNATTQEEQQKKRTNMDQWWNKNIQSLPSVMELGDVSFQ